MPVSLMAAGELRTALEAHARGDVPAAVGALMSIDAASWQAIEERLATLGGTLPALLAALKGATP
ncbi:hypothetical protein QZH56_22825 [Streptomyces olivoreticuli]|uniref:hypothetical protein n=1 Tax=Streptomyces olivoreticuli TaxID=68246 RepID=UPI00265AC324|nr:hypothetical protein [Streptomyces olivoreticuli]WKK21675.1 hypothetical protein QZH56_22825 [Streptomyces olivoreticuli]